MKRALKSSLITTGITTFVMLVLLFFLNTEHPFLLLIIFFGLIALFFLFKLLLRLTKPDSEKGRQTLVPAAATLFAAFLIAAYTIEMLRII